MIALSMSISINHKIPVHLSQFWILSQTVLVKVINYRAHVIVRFIQLALYANTHDNHNKDITVFLLGDEVVLCFDVGLEGVDVLAFIFFDICGYSL